MAGCAAIAMLNGCGSVADGPEPSAGAPKTMALLFVSPMGEPFRPGPKSEKPFDIWIAQADKDGATMYVVAPLSRDDIAECETEQASSNEPRGE